VKTIDLSAVPPPRQELLAMASEGSLLLRTPEGREFVLSEVDDLDEEVALIRQNQERLRFLEERSRETETFTLEEVRKKLDLE
jgi:hypothetical protein